MFNKVLIANRGEIAVRIIRTCKEMGIKTVAVYSALDKDSLHVLLADESVCIGERTAKESYLNTANILSVASLYNCDAIHPGVGFLSENAKFASMCEDVGIQFVGPRSQVIKMMGNKSTARQMMKDNDIPIVPGTGIIKSVDEGIRLAKKIGYPILIKASAGGGGKGMRICYAKDTFKQKFFAAKNEAKNAFGNDEVYIEKLIKNPRHIEIQILSDRYGNTIHLGERDCTIQRNHQKMIEESPSVLINESLRSTLGHVAKKVAEVINYTNAGTVEFLVDQDKNYYFIEMNTRIQVEHPVTEMITGIDLIKEQFKIAAGEKLSFEQEDIVLNGHAIEVRINAEDPKNNFIPSPGTIELKSLPGGRNIRFDSFIYNDYSIPPAYDSLLGKLIVKGNSREDAINRMTRALSELSILGVETTIEFLYQIFQDNQFKTSNYDTSYIENYFTKVGDQDA